MRRHLCTLSLWSWLAALPAAGAEEKAEEKPIELKAYGFILVNVHLTDGLTAPADIPVRAIGEEDSSFSIFVRQTRLGLKAGGPEVGSAKLDGTVEIDFWGLRGSVPAGNVLQTAPRLRLAFLRLVWERTTLTVGQDWTWAFAPLSPTSLAHVSIPEFAGSGNLWNRLPQVRLDHEVELSDSYKLGLSAALTRPFGGDAAPVPVSQDDPLGAGELSGLPFVQARAALSGPFAGKSFTIGVSGHLGREEFRAAELDTRAVALDVSVPLGKVAALSGEGYVGENLRMLFSNSFVIEDPNTAQDAEAGITAGGWVQINAGVGSKGSVNAGYGIEKLDEEQISSGLRKNETLFGNLIWSFSKHFKLGVELTHIRTTLSGEADQKISATAFDVAWQFVF
jgi:hypothetical protein